jgi:hypothetical protein
LIRPVICSTWSRSCRYSWTSSRLGTAIWTSTSRVPQIRTAPKQGFEAQQALDDALGVVQPVDAEQHGAPCELITQLGDVRVGLLAAREVGELVEVDRDRRRRRGDGPSVRRVEVAATDLHAVVGQQPSAGTHEALAVPVRVEADDVGAERPEQQVSAPRDAGEDVGRGPRGVQEQAAALLRTLTADELGHQEQVVVVHPQQSVVVAVDRRHGSVGETLVHRGVRRPPGPLEHRLLDGVVQQRPQGPVGEAVVVVADLRSGQGHRRQLDRHVRKG